MARDLLLRVSLLLNAEPTRGITRGWYFTVVLLADRNDIVPSASEWCVFSLFNTRCSSSGMNGTLSSSCSWRFFLLVEVLSMFLLLSLLSLGDEALFSYKSNAYIHIRA